MSKYSEEELNKKIVEALEFAHIKPLCFRITSNMDNGLGRILYPKFTLEISGGDSDKLNELKLKLMNLIIEFTQK